MGKFRKKIEKIGKKWLAREVDQAHLSELADSLGISPVLAQVLLNREIVSPDKVRAFLRPSLKDLILPDKLLNIDIAVERVVRALEKKEKIVVYGDYDVDGITATSILCRLFDILGAEYNFYIPHRLEEGYGLNKAAIAEIAENGASLIITVDCGISSFGEIDYAKELGIDVIITDHHVPDDNLPDAVAVLHPMLGDYPTPKSCGAMISMKLAWAICERYRNNGLSDEQCKKYLLIATDFASLGTVADVMPLTGENRALLSYGLNSLTMSSLAGIKALIGTAGLDGKSLDAIDLSFRLAPMLNAAGRLGHARLAVELLTTDSEIRALRIAEFLKDQNNQRKKMETQIFKEASHIITASGLDHPDKKSIVMAGDSWHLGVVGIVASRVIEKYFKPTILLNSDGEIAKGSARTVPGFNILNAIDSCSKHLMKYGGHAEAAGMTIKMAKLPEFINDFETYARANITDDHLIQKLNIEGEFCLKDFDFRTVDQLEKLSPFGNGNPRPIFVTRGVRLEGAPQKMGSGNEHIRFVIRDASGYMQCVGFNMVSIYNKLIESDYFSIAYEPRMNQYNGNRTPQFVVKDVNFD